MCKLADDINALGRPNELIPVLCITGQRVSHQESHVGTLATMVESGLVPSGTVRFLLGDDHSLPGPRRQIVILAMRPQTRELLPASL